MLGIARNVVRGVLVHYVGIPFLPTMRISLPKESPMQLVVHEDAYKIAKGQGKSSQITLGDSPKLGTQRR